MIRIPLNARKWAVAGLGIFGLLTGILSFWFMTHLPSQSMVSQTVVVRAGMDAAQIGRLLEAKGIISNAAVFHVAAKWHRLDGALQAGEYSFPPKATVADVIERLSRGQTNQVSLTIPEGWTVEQIAQAIGNRGLGDPAKVLAHAQKMAPYSYIPAVQQQKYRVEGFLFPDTYSLAKGMGEEEILRLLAAQFDQKLTADMRKRAEALGLSPYQLITLASIVEREAQREEERPIIAAVFLKRLQIGMPLQSCATIQYILGDPKAELTIQDTQIQSPYNTYLIPGLPPGPVSNPGLASIQAVLQPTQHELLYFVARKDGSHIFSRTYAEHLVAIEQVSK